MVRQARRGSIGLPVALAAFLAVSLVAPDPVGATTLVETLPIAATMPLPTDPTAGGTAEPGPAATPPAPPAPPGTTSGTVPGAVDRTSLDVSATYDLDLRLRVAARRLRGTVTIVAENRSGDGIDRLELNTVMARLGELRLGTVTVDGNPVRATIDDQTIIVPLGGVLPDGATAEVVLPFSARLRTTLAGSGWLFARANGIVDLYRWIPWVSRRHPFDRPNHGDPFVTPVSPLVTVRIRSDVRLRYATTGDPVATSADGRTRTFRASNVRDFVVTAAADYRTREAIVGDTVVRMVFRPGFPAATALGAARRALARLEARLGPYPYDALTVVQSAGRYGMEGPGVVWVPTGIARSSIRYYVTHEVAHQWFYALVGTDQAREPFADEAAVDFVTRFLLDMRRGSRCPADRLDRTIYDYSSECYYEVVYVQGANLLDDARRRMGDAAFWAALRGFLAANRYGLVSTRDMLDALDAGTELDLRSWWADRFPGLY